MRQALSISALATSVGVTAKTVRYWEGIGLLPRANRTHTGYRIFAPEVIHYMDFILKAKSVGLTLSEMKRVIKLAHDGENPCPEVMQWIGDKDRALEQQIQSMRALQRRLRRFRRACRPPRMSAHNRRLGRVAPVDTLTALAKSASHLQRIAFPLPVEGEIFFLTFPFIDQAIALTTGMASQDTGRVTGNSDTGHRHVDSMAGCVRVDDSPINRPIPGLWAQWGCYASYPVRPAQPLCIH